MDTASRARPADAHGPSISRDAAASGPIRAMRPISRERGRYRRAVGQENDRPSSDLARQVSTLGVPAPCGQAEPRR